MKPGIISLLTMVALCGALTSCGAFRVATRAVGLAGEAIGLPAPSDAPASGNVPATLYGAAIERERTDAIHDILNLSREAGE